VFVNIITRRANTSDVDWLVAQLMEFSNFYGTRLALFSTPEYVRGAVEAMIKNQPVFVALGCNDRGIIDRLGFIAGVATPHPFNPNIRVFSEQFFWVTPDHRGSRASFLLLTDFLFWGKNNADWITFALEGRSPMNERALTKRGFKLQERSYLLEVA